MNKWLSAAGVVLVVGLGVTALIKKRGDAPRPTNPPVTQRTASFQDIAKWDVQYHDATLGDVHGVAFCKWNTAFEGDSAPHCRVRLRNPITGDLAELTADHFDISPPSEKSDRLEITLEGQSPSAGAVAPPDEGRTAAAGSTATVSLKNGDTEMAFDAPVVPRADVDNGRVKLSLFPMSDSTLIGSWSYRSDASTQRDASGRGRVGSFSTLEDGERGFQSRMSGGELWRPLIPRIYEVRVLEDQAGYANGAAKYAMQRGVPSLSRGFPDASAYPNAVRTLVIIGTDLPVLENEDYDHIHGSDNDIIYRVVADSRAKTLSDDRRRQIEQAFNDLTSTWSAADAAEWRKLDAVVVEASVAFVEPGPKTIVWGPGEAKWTLQYGDNTADVRFVRVIRESGPAPAQPAESPRRRRQTTRDLKGIHPPENEVELVTQVAMPERIAIEVETGPISDASIPVVLGGRAVYGQSIPMVATRTSEGANIYRTQPFAIAEPGAVPSSVSADAVLAVRGQPLLAKVDDAKTHFVRATLATAVTGTPDTALWHDALTKAAACTKNPVNPADWGATARKTSPAVTLKGVSVDVSVGDHATMLLTRQAFVNSLNAQLAELGKIDGEAVSDAAGDFTIDAWYRSIQQAVTFYGKDSPLGSFEVSSPAGKVPFKQAYSREFEEQTFHTSKAADGPAHFREWRRRASHEALSFYRTTIKKAISDASNVPDCNREKLLELTGTGFGRITAQILPLLMQPGRGTGPQLSEPDFLARGYVGNLSSVYERLQSVKEYSSAKTAVALACVQIAVPFMPVALGVIGTTAVHLGEAALTAGNVALSIYGSAAQIYQTYQEREEIKFAFASSGAIGLDRYFDADYRKTPVWQTVAQVVGDTVMNAYGVYDAQLRLTTPLGESYSLWRGGRIAGRLEAGAITRGALGNQELYDLAMFELKEHQMLAQRAITTTAGLAADSVLQKLAGGAKGAPGEPQIEQAINQQALAAIGGGNPPQPPAIAQAEQALAKAALADEGMVAELADEAKMAQKAAAAAPRAPPAANEIPKQLKPFPTGPDLPPAPGVWTIKRPGAPEGVTFDIERFVNSGGLAHVYKLKAPPTNLPAPLKPGLQGKTLVVKFLNVPDDVKLMTAGGSALRQAEFLDQFRPDLWERLDQAEQIVAAGGAQVIPHAEFQVFADEGFMLQEFLEETPGKLEFLPVEISPADFIKTVPKEKRRAIAKLAVQLGNKNIEMHDFHRGNVYLENENGWVAKVMDPDFINNYGTRMPSIETFHNELMIESPVTSDAVSKSVSSGLESQMKIMERKLWLGFRPSARTYVNGYLEVSDFDGLLPKDWQFMPGAQPPAR